MKLSKFGLGNAAQPTTVWRVVNSIEYVAMPKKIQSP